jgi:hypothetical protein
MDYCDDPDMLVFVVMIRPFVMVMIIGSILTVIGVMLRCLPTMGVLVVVMRPFHMMSFGAHS